MPASPVTVIVTMPPKTGGVGPTTMASILLLLASCESITEKLWDGEVVFATAGGGLALYKLTVAVGRVPVLISAIALT